MRKELGFWEVFAIGVGGMIGGGIFAVLGLSLELADGAAPLAFLLAGLVALITSYSYAKLSSRFPSEGGTIEFLVQGYGDGVLSGGLNIMLLASYIVMIALYAHAFASYGASLLPSHYSIAYVALTVFIVASLTLVNMLGSIISGRLELALVAFKLSILIFVVIVSLGLVDWSRLSPSKWPPPSSIVAGGMIIFLAYEGFELVANTAGDVESLTTLRRALYASVATVVSVYILIALVAAGALSPETVAKARDYALAILVKPVLGMAGVALVVAAALASTGSAINATLYGTARMSYIIAKYGQVPKVLGKRVWHGAYEGLLIIATFSLALALGASLETISAAGSGGFLIVFAAVNYAAYRLRWKTGANPFITLLGTILSLLALNILIYRMTLINPSQLAVLAILIIGSFLAEASYRAATGRRLPKYVDWRLEEREKLIFEWEKWLPNLVHAVKEVFRDAEIYLVGSIARREIHRAGDVDILIATHQRISKKEASKVIRSLAIKIGLPPHHPIDVHVTRKPAKSVKESKRLA